RTYRRDLPARASPPEARLHGLVEASHAFEQQALGRLRDHPLAWLHGWVDRELSLAQPEQLVEGPRAALRAGRRVDDGPFEEEHLAAHRLARDPERARLSPVAQRGDEVGKPELRERARQPL